MADKIIDDGRRKMAEYMMADEEIDHHEKSEEIKDADRSHIRQLRDIAVDNSRLLKRAWVSHRKGLESNAKMISDVGQFYIFWKYITFDGRRLWETDYEILDREFSFIIYVVKTFYVYLCRQIFMIFGGRNGCYELVLIDSIPYGPVSNP